RRDGALQSPGECEMRRRGPALGIDPARGQGCPDLTDARDERCAPQREASLLRQPPDPIEGIGKLVRELADAFDRVWRLAEERGLSLRSAALVAGIREVGAALTSRGIYP